MRERGEEGCQLRRLGNGMELNGMEWEWVDILKSPGHSFQSFAVCETGDMIDPRPGTNIQNDAQI
jgi:hypothetical protein